MLRAEQTRARLLGVVFGGILLLAPLALLNDDPISRAAGTSQVKWFGSGALLGAALFEGGLAWWYHRCLAVGRLPPRALYWGSAAIEALFPSVAVLVAARFLGAVDAYVVPPAHLYFVLLVLAPLRLDPQLCLFTGAVSALGYLGVAGLTLADAAQRAPTLLAAGWLPHLGKAGLLMVSGAIAAFVTQQLLRRQALALELERERERVIQIFGQHVSPQVVDKVLAQDAELPSETRHVCVMFLDIRGFTSFSEARTPEEVVAYLNTLFEPLVDIVSAHHGIINKFLGDGFMAVFGAPHSDGEDCLNAVRAARAMLTAVDELVTAGRLPPTRIGIGLHAGSAVTGTVGSRQRKEYTLIGDTVNLASRVEGLNKDHGSQLLVTASVWQPVAGALGADVHAEALPPVAVKGRAEPVAVWRLA